MANTDPNKQTPKPARPRGKRARPIMELAGIDPVTREKVARWLDAHVPGLRDEIVEVQYQMNIGQRFHGDENVVAYKSILIAAIKQLSHEMRTARGGPLAGKTKFAKLPKSTPTNVQ